MAGRFFTRGQLAWAFFDWANQPYFTLILTFIFGPYFATKLAADPVTGQAMWGYFQAAAGLAIALGGPVFGAIADAGGRRKPWCGAFAALGVAGAAGLWLAAPGSGTLLAGMMMLLASIGFEIAIVFNNAFLPHVATPGREGRLSGFGWGLGYLGGLVALGLALYGLYLPDDPWFGLDKAAGEDARIVGPLSSLWFIIFALPFFLLTPERGGRGVPLRAAVGQGLGTLRHTLAGIGHYRTILIFLIARMIYTDGLLAIFSFGGIFAAATFGWGTTQMGVFGIVTLVFAALGSFPGGWAGDRFGAKRTILAGLVGLAAAILTVLSLGSGGIAFGLIETAPADGDMTSAPEIVMILAAALIGFCAGPVQAASRTLMARLTPREMAAEFFGLYAFSGKATAFVAPLVIGLATDFFDAQRVSLVAVLAFLGLGGIILARVVEPPLADPGESA